MKREVVSCLTEISAQSNVVKPINKEHPELTIYPTDTIQQLNQVANNFDLFPNFQPEATLSCIVRKNILAVKCVLFYIEKKANWNCCSKEEEVTKRNIH